MTVSAPVRLMPSPPARVARMKMKILGERLYLWEGGGEMGERLCAWGRGGVEVRGSGSAWECAW